MEFEEEFTQEDLDSCWPHHKGYLLEILNGLYNVESARDDLRSLVGTKFDPRVTKREPT